MINGDVEQLDPTMPEAMILFFHIYESTNPFILCLKKLKLIFLFALSHG